MRRYKLTLTRKDIAKRLAVYPPRLLREVMLLLDKFEIQHDLQYIYEQSQAERKAVQKELLTAWYQEHGATKSEIATLLKRSGFE
jgi:hypothetical protein